MLNFDYLKKKRILIAAFIWTIAMLLPGMLLQLAGLDVGWIAMLLSVFTCTLFLLFTGRQLWQQAAQNTQELHRWNEAWMQIHQLVKFRYPLPASTSYSMAPDALLYILQQILRKKPAVVVELGAGLSTLLITQLIRQYHLPVKLYSIESDEDYLKTIQEQVNEQGNADAVHFILAPLSKKPPLQNWYALPEKWDTRIQMLIVDGPPKSSGENARYAALPYFYENLDAGALVLVDDAARKDLQWCLTQWKKEFPDLSFQTLRLTRAVTQLTKP